MKLIEMHICVNQEGRIMIPDELPGTAGLKPGDQLQVTTALREENDNLCPLVLLTSQGVEVAIQLSGWQEDDEINDLTLPNELLETAEIPEDSDLDIFCTAGAIVIMKADILDKLPDELRELFNKLGVNPGTVREVMRKEGYFV